MNDPLEIPEHIRKAAATVEIFFKVNGINEWALMGIQSRRIEPAPTIAEINSALDAAGCPTGNEHKTYDAVERIAGLHKTEDYAWRQLDAERAAREQAETRLLQGIPLTAPNRTWIACPVCDEPDMRCESDHHGNQRIFCVNHDCASNGGRSDKRAEQSEARLAAAHAVMDKGANIGWGNAVTVEIERQQNLKERAEAELAALKLKLEAAKDHFNCIMEELERSDPASRNYIKMLCKQALSQLNDGEKRGPTCREYRLAIGDDQGNAMGIPMSEELLDDWIKRRESIRAFTRAINNP